MRNLWRIGALLICVVLIMGAYLEQGQTGSGERRWMPPRPTPFPGDMCNARQAVGDMAAGVDIGAAKRRMGVVIVPVVSDGWRGDGSITSMDLAIRRGNLKVRERGNGSVPWLEVQNTSRKPVLLMAGEILLGGKQNRLVANDFLIPARSEWEGVPVFCGQQHRWSGGSGPMFKASGKMVPAPMRDNLAGSATQDSIWHGASEELSRFGATARTGNIQNVYEDGRLAEALKCFHRPQWGSFPRRTVGMVVIAGTRVLGVEVFANGRVFRDNWKKVLDSILAGYPPVLKSCGRMKDYEKPGYANYEHIAEQALRDLSRARFTSNFGGGLGCGAYMQASSGSRGQVLTANSSLVHAGMVNAFHPIRVFE